MQVEIVKRGIAQSGSAPALGAGCREFESLYPDQILAGLRKQAGQSGKKMRSAMFLSLGKFQGNCKLSGSGSLASLRPIRSSARSSTG